MSEKRKPSIVIVATKNGKRTRLELYPVHLWPEARRNLAGRYRARVNGKWRDTTPAKRWENRHTYTLSQATAQLRGFLSSRGPYRKRPPIEIGPVETDDD